MSQTIEMPRAPAARTVAAPRADAPPRVALMGRSLRGTYSGVVRYTDELARALAARLGGQLSVFVTRGDDGLDGAPLRRIRAPFRTPNEYARALWEQAVVPIDVRRLRPDVYHSPNYIIPAALACPSIVTVHDTAFLDRSVHRITSHLYLSALTAVALRKATRVVCVSQYTAGVLVARYPRVAAKVRVIGEGVGERFSPQPRQAVRTLRARLGLERPYLLFVGTVEPRKNIARLIRAFEIAVQREGLPHDLVLAGADGWKMRSVRAAYERSPLRDRIRRIGYLPDADLPAMYAGADAFVYPSLLEGYGLPPLEAMACGTPVMTSSTTALGEVAGPAALTVEPRDTAALADAIARVLGDGVLRDALRERGFARAAALRWDAVADEMIALYREVAAS
jgi:glycosyltransferase involved in cell wall biosynthesis